MRAGLTLTVWTLQCAALVASPVLAAPSSCSCEHLEALRVELKNARTLQRRFQQKSDELRLMGPGSSQGELKRWYDKGEASRGIKASPGYTGPESVEYVPQGNNVHWDAIDRYSNTKLCAFSKNSSRDLDRAVRGSQCLDIAEAIRVHEMEHQSQCLANGYRGYVHMHGADRALEEAAAYEVTINRLREGIRHVFVNTHPTVMVTAQARTTWSANSLPPGIDVHNVAKIEVSPVAESPTELRFEGRGERVSNVTALGGNCTTTNMPALFQEHATLSTDGETARVRMAPEGKSSAWGMRCRIPGTDKHFSSVCRSFALFRRPLPSR